MDSLLEEAMAMQDDLVGLRRCFHQMPELGFDLFKTRAKVKEELMRIGLAVKECGGGLVAQIQAGLDGDATLLRSDMDALPMKEQSGLPFSSEGETAHTCGHDLHMAMLLGAAQLLVRHKDELAHPVRLVFQPAEETAEGARAMVESGVLEGVSRAVGLHTAPGRRTGLVNCTPGEKYASYDKFQITVKGTGGHGAMPQLASDPILPAAMICQALNALTTKEFAPGSGAVLSIGSFHAGEAENVIPDQAVLGGTFRTRTREDRERFQKRIPQIAEHIASAGGVKADTSLPQGVPVLYNDPDLCARMRRVLEERLGSDFLDAAEERLSVSEDFSVIAGQVPSVYMTIGTGDAAQGFLYGNHNPKVLYDEEAIPIGAAVFAAAGLYLQAF